MKKNYVALLLSFCCALPIPLFGQTFDIGSATGSNSAFDYPAPFGRYYYGSRHQFVYTVAELQAAGLTSAAALDSLGFNVTAVNAADNHARFTIRVGNVANANLAGGWIDTTQLTRVYRNDSGVQPVVGWNMFKLDEPFVWDGTSDLVVETFHNDNILYTENASTQWTDNLSLAITPTRFINLDNSSDDAFYTGEGNTSASTRTDIRLVIASPLFRATPSAKDFNNVQVNTTSAPQTFTLRNIGNGSIFLNNIELIGTNASEFSLSGLPSLPTTLTTNTVTFNAAAAPTTTGAKSASVRLTYTTSESSEEITAFIQLTAQGVGEAPQFGVLPSSINFGQFSNGATTSARFVTVKNLAGGGLVINGASLSGIDASRFGLVDTNTYPKTLGVNNSLRFGVTFSPIAAQSYSAVVNITHSGTITETVSLSGTGVDFFVVDNNNNAGDGTLRKAIEDVNKAGGTQTIQILTTGEINLLSNLPTIAANVNIIGPGASQIAVQKDNSAPNNVRIFAIAADATVSISGLSMRNGNLTGVGSQDGGGIFNQGNLILTDCIISNNNSGCNEGGGIFNSGTLTLNNTTVTSNFNDTYDGGGIYNTGTLTVNNSTISNNEGSDGGGIHNAGTLSVNGSTFNGNVGSSRGGGIFNSGSMRLSNTLILSNSVIFGGKRGGKPLMRKPTLLPVTNQSKTVRTTRENMRGGNPNLEGGFSGGGGIFTGGTDDTLLNCQVLDNVSEFGGGGICVDFGGLVLQNTSVRLNRAEESTSGGGILNSGEIILEEATVDSNFATSDGGGVYLASSGEVTARRSVISRNRSEFDAGGGIFVSSGTVNLSNSTVTANVSGAGGSGIHINNEFGLLNVENSIIYSNFQDGVDDIRDLFGVYVASPLSGLNSLGYNLIGTLTTASSIGGNVATNLNAPPQFVDSANGNYRVLPTSPAVDNGNPLLLPPLGGEPFVDIGAFEVIANTVPTGNPSVGTSFTVLGGGSFALRAETGTADVSVQQFFTLAPNITQGRAISRYWDINANTPSFLRFYYRQSEVDDAGFTSNPLIYHFTGGTWVAVPTTAPFTLANGIRYVESTSPVTSFSPFTLGDPDDAPLPVELTNFRGTSSFGKVNLTWKTVSEIDNQGFMVIRDGVQIASFENYPELVGQGTSTEAKNYAFTDVSVEVGKTYTYTLRSRDFNGTLHNYPDRVSVKVEAGSAVVYEYRLAQNYPNPFNPSTRIEYGVKARGLVTIQLYDVLGRVVATLVNEVKDAGNYAVTFNASALSSGVYFYRYTAGGKTFTKQMLFVK